MTTPNNLPGMKQTPKKYQVCAFCGCRTSKWDDFDGKIKCSICDELMKGLTITDPQVVLLSVLVSRAIRIIKKGMFVR